jgi:flagellin FlaB
MLIYLKGEKMLKKLSRAIQRLQRGEKGITGLETAIILIAFVTVASVLGYSVLSAGIFSAEKGKETVYQGLAQAQASMEVKGSVYATVDLTDSKVTDITFDLASVLNDQAVDMTPHTTTGTQSNTTVISYTDSTGTYNDVTWTATPLGVNTGDKSGMLKPNEQMEIDVTLPTTGPGADLTTYSTFTIQIVPATGAAITIERTLPGLLGSSVDLN